MLEHIANLLGADIKEVCQCFPNNCSLLPINVPPPCPLSPNVAIPSLPTLQYPGTELEHYIDPLYPNSPPSVSPSSPIDPSMLQIIAEGEQYEDEEAWNNHVIQGPQLRRSSPHLPLTDITPIHQVLLPILDGTDYEELAMVLYCQVSDQDKKIAAMEADKENQAPSPTNPQPSTHPSLGWQDNFNATGTCHLFVIPNGDEDIIAPFIHYDLHNPFPELLAMNRHHCTIYLHPLHAVPQISCASPLSSCNELFFHPDLKLTRGVDWAVLWEDDPMLAGEVQHFHSHKKACDCLARCMGQLCESLEVECQALYHSLAHLTGANALRCLQRHIDSSLHIAPSFSKVQVCKIHMSIKNCIAKA